jgi:hypothetical protein
MLEISADFDDKIKGNCLGMLDSRKCHKYLCIFAMERRLGERVYLTRTDPPLFKYRIWT